MDDAIRETGSTPTEDRPVDTSADGTGTSRKSRGRRIDDRAASRTAEPGAKTEKETETLVVEVTGEPAQPVRRRRRRTTKKQQADAELAKTLLDVVEAAAISIAGPVAAFAPTERALIEPSLARTLARQDAEKLAAYASFLDPVLMLVGLGLYVSRVNKATTRREQDKKPAERQVEIKQVLKAKDDTMPEAAVPLRQNLVARG